MARDAVNDGYLHYNALDLNITRNLSRGFSALFSYTWSHTLDSVDPDTTSEPERYELHPAH